MDYFIKPLQSGSEDYHIQAMLSGIRGLVGLFGPDIAKPYESLFERYKTETGASYVKDAAAGLLDDMAGRR